MQGESNNRDFDLQEPLEQRLAEILNAMPIAVSWSTLKDQKLRFVNKKFTQMFGYILGDHPTIEHWITHAYPNPEHIERANAMWMPYLTSNSIHPIEIPQVEVDVLCKDGDVKTTLLGGVLLPHDGWGLATFVDITDRKEHEVKVEKQALEDSLTGLANRRAFNEILRTSLSRTERAKNKTGLLLVDLDEFKPLNDTMGHDQGDIVLQNVAERLKRGVRGGDVVCRLGGDEFCVIVDSMRDIRTAEEIADRIIEEIRKPFALEDKPVKLSISIGISVYPDDADEPTGLYKKADEALYRAKDAGRGRWSH